MNLLFSECTVKVTSDELAEINELIRRSKPMAVIDGSGYYKCPTCKEVLYRNVKYCHNCGQRVDQDNIAL